MYQQIILSTQAVGTSRFKSLAQSTSQSTLSTIEKDILANKNRPAIICEAEACNPPSAAVIDAIIKGGTNDHFTKLNDTPVGTDVHYRIQNLGSSAEFTGQTLYRTTIITNIMGTVDVIESVFAATAI